MSNAGTLYLHGSCVSRDTAGSFEPYGLTVIGYTARQSVISSMSPKPAHLASLTADRLTSGFQRRAVEGDLRSDIHESLRGCGSPPQALLLDLVDERNGVWSLADSSFVTNSRELTRSGILDDLGPERELIAFGSDRHFKLWASALAAYDDSLRERGMAPEQVIVIDADWASESIDGQLFPFGDSKQDPEQMNRDSRRYFAFAELLGFQLIRVPKPLCIAAPDHQWGIAPFHYTREFYRYTSRRIARALEELS